MADKSGTGRVKRKQVVLSTENKLAILHKMKDSVPQSRLIEQVWSGLTNLYRPEEQ